MSVSPVEHCAGEADAALKVVVCWHMHQPDYRDPDTGEFLQPWVYLHTIKDYVDMAYHLEQAPAAKAVVNFSSILLEQLDVYANALRNTGFNEVLPDPLLEVLRGHFPEGATQREAVVRACMRANEERIVQRFDAYRALLEYAQVALSIEDGARFLSDQFLRELVIWYHLGWMGESVRRTDLRVARLSEKARQFDIADAHALLALIAELTCGVVERYRRLSIAGQIELSITPGAHPMFPMLIDFDAARESRADLPIPTAAYPGGVERSYVHITEGARHFAKAFGEDAVGCWPSEGGVSDATLRLLSDVGFVWAASGETVLHNSLHALGRTNTADDLNRPYRFDDDGPVCFFRNDHLSDLIGFTFAQWHGDDAAGHVIETLGQLRASLAEPREHVVAIVLDGENAWEHYPDNGAHFLRAFYDSLVATPWLNLTTFAGACDAGSAIRTLPSVVAGSWVYGAFDTWVGHPDKNRGWELLTDAKRALDEALPGLSASQAERALAQLSVCE
ncbi:MAG: glycoside hydrolase, partial [Gammaproteobacteria bacterium]|nr:glycoside hydrolase [Gammaproteobacteria bacterium]